MNSTIFGKTIFGKNRKINNINNFFIALIIPLLFLFSCGSEKKEELMPIDLCDDANSSFVYPEGEKGVERRAKDILATMSLEQKVGQVIQADISSITPADVKKYRLGSVLNGGNSAPGGGKIAPVSAWIDLADQFWEASMEENGDCVNIPIIWGTDAVHGHNNLQMATIFPHNSAIGATNDIELAYRIAKVTAKEVKATGIDWTFAPTLAVAQDDRWGRAYESYSEIPENVLLFSEAMVEGLQGSKKIDNFLKGDKVIATAKHFIGDGGTEFGIDKGDTILKKSILLHVHGQAYRTAILSDVQTIMASFSSVNGEKVHGSKELLTDILRGDFKFKGFVIGDWNGHAEIPGCTAGDCPEALIAGVDMYMAPDSWKELYHSLLNQVNNGELDEFYLDRAVLRILKVKIRAGMFEEVKPSLRPTTGEQFIGTEEAKEVAREVVRKSLVLLKNNDNTLPLSPKMNVLVTGSGADSMQQQTGGWTLSWQGDDNPNEIFENGSTIFAGIKEKIEQAGGKVTLSNDGSYDEKPDVAIVVYGEHPYAEYRGDRQNLVYEFNDGENLALLRKYKNENIKVVSLFLTGRPLWVNPHINASDAFVVTWLPGTEGGSVSDVIIADNDGNPRYDFWGRLSFSWPNNGKGDPITSRSEGTLFKPYYGLNYSNEGNLEKLSEDSLVPRINEVFDGFVMKNGDVVNGFSFYLGDTSNLNTPLKTLKGNSLGKKIFSKAVDYKAQEDARTISWVSDEEANFSIRNSEGIDLGKFGNIDKLSLNFVWKADEMPKNASLTISCGENCQASTELQSYVANMEKGNWVTTNIPIKCFVENGLDASNVTSLVKINAKSMGEISLHEIKISENDTAYSCE